ncbi:unnamed protein product [Oikopleura dioica]|uniref:Uncharacterized protein n=1 Tax=Oikopleura dioica TaxID=34765 RepID=E4XIP5_OIKDI|nr:unnamed protein product [Oikopleura dioica]
MNRIISKRGISLSFTPHGQGKLYTSRAQNARHRGNYPHIHQEITPGVQLETLRDNHLEPKSNFQGFNHRLWQNRNVRTNLELPKFSDFSQGELVQEELIYDYPGTKKAPFTARTRAVCEKVPLIIAPSVDCLCKSKFKPFVANTVARRGNQNWLNVED